MPFDAKKFLKTKFMHRTEDVPVPDLAAFFPEGARPVWRVRGLTGHELGRSNEAAARNKSILAILEGITSAMSKDTTQAIRELIGTDGSTPQDVAKRIEQLVIGSVDPECTQELAVRLCEVKPIEFWALTNMIVRLTGLGQMPGKQEPSGETPKSAPASPSLTPEGASCSS